MDWIVITTVVAGWTALVWSFGWARGHRKGMDEGVKLGFAKYTRLLKFERREEMPLVNPTDQPHARRPKGRARVTDAHMSQVRRHWLEPGS